VSILVLGGTADGRHLSQQLYHQGINVIYSVAGLVRIPDLDCEVISGGFSQRGGLVHFIQQRHITAIIDVTHPYAQTMSNTAVDAAKACHIPCWRFHRLPWEPQTTDQWQECQTFAEAIPLLQTKHSVFLSAGQLSQEQINQLLLNIRKTQQQRQWLRTAVKPNVKLPKTMQWIKAIGPFSYDNELQLLKQYRVDIIVSKNSGGEATIAKLQAARALSIPVIMLQRPELKHADKTFHSLTECEKQLIATFKPQ